MKMLVVNSVSKSVGARYSNVNGVMHIERQRAYTVCWLFKVVDAAL